MKTDVCERLGCELPIFAFSHCRDVVAAVSAAGGFGVLGASTYSPEQLAVELDWLDANTGGRPYGVDMLFPTRFDARADTSPSGIEHLIPGEHWDFVDRVLLQAGVPELSAEERASLFQELTRGRGAMTPQGARVLVDTALQHQQVKLLVSALGVPSSDVMADLRAAQVVSGAMVGKARHAAKHVEAGVEVIVAQGTEAGGHTGDLTTMVLVPEIVRTVGEGVPVLAAGGITQGSQIAAALAMGAQGVWLGTIWLGTVESELGEFEKQVLFETESDGTIRSKARTGKTVRMVKSQLSEAFDGSDSPGYLPTPLQGVLYNYAHARVVRARRKDLFSFPVGQSVGALRGETKVADVMYRLQLEYVEALERLGDLSQG